MSLVDERAQSSSPTVEHEGRPAEAVDGALDLRGPFFSSREAAAYIRCKSVRAFYEWCRRHGVTRRRNGSIAKAEIDRELNRKRRPRVMAVASLVNLRKRRKAS